MGGLQEAMSACRLDAAFESVAFALNAFCLDMSS